MDESRSDRVRIESRDVGAGSPCFVIAEAGVNHNGDLTTALAMIRAAADAGADAVKFQTFTADALLTADAPKADYQRQTTDPAESQYAMLRKLELSADAHRELKRACADAGILFLSTPFDRRSADMLAELDVPAYKISSPDLVDLPLLAHVARAGKPMLVSTGAATVQEIATALDTITEAGAPDVVLLHCVTSYPADPSAVNLRAMATMAATFKRPVGYSDHTFGIEVPLAAAALGACVVEKHFTLDRAMSGPDHAASAEPHELAALVRGIRLIERALGDGIKAPAPSEIAVAAVARKSLVAGCGIAAGTRLTDDMVTMKRPASGLPATVLPELRGRIAVVDIAAGTRLRREMFCAEPRPL